MFFSHRGGGGGDQFNEINSQPQYFKELVGEVLSLYSFSQLFVYFHLFVHACKLLANR